MSQSGVIQLCAFVHELTNSVSEEHANKILTVLRGNKEIALLLLENKGHLLEYFDDGIKDDFNIVACAIKHYPEAINHASLRLQYNISLVKIFLESCIPNGALPSASILNNDIFTDIDIVKLFLKYDGLILENLSPELKENYDIVYQAVTKNGLALRYAHPVLKKNIKVVEAAVRNDGRALYYADSILRKNRTIVALAIESHWLALSFADVQLKDDPDLVKRAVKKNPDAIEFASERIRNNPSLLVGIYTKSAR